MIFGIGTDIIDVRRIRRSVTGSAAFVKRVFSQAEKSYCDEARGKLRFERYAGRFAAKEAFLKACGLGLSGPFRLNEITVGHSKEKQPEIRLAGETEKTFQGRIGGRIFLSLSHLPEYAVATVLIER
jgi:holo-[acyl-carrier protein] synthase